MKNKKKRIAFLCQFFYPEKVSSATLPYDLAKYLAENGFNVFCLCGYPKEYLKQKGKIKKEEIVDGIRIKRLKYLMPSRKSVIGRIINFFSFTCKCLLYKRCFKDYDYLIVYSNPPILPYVAYKVHKKYGTKIVFVSYDVYPEIAINTHSISKDGFIAKTMRRINKTIFSSVDKVVALSQDMKDYLVANRDIDGNKIIVIPNWFDLEKVKYKEKTKSITVTYLGNLGTCQDTDTILECAKLLKKDRYIRFVLGGHGNKVDAIKNFILKNELENIELKDFLTGEDYYNAMTKSDCFIISLEKNINGLCFPSKYYSYLAYGRPIIAICESGSLSNEIIDNHIGFHTTNGQTYELSLIIKTIQTMSSDVYRSICLGSRLLFEKYYSVEKVMPLFLRIFD